MECRADVSGKFGLEGDPESVIESGRTVVENPPDSGSGLGAFVSGLPVSGMPAVLWSDERCDRISWSLVSDLECCEGVSETPDSENDSKVSLEPGLPLVASV